MKIATATLKSVSPYSQSRMHETPTKSREAPDKYELRTWREKCHYNKDGRIFIPSMAFKLGLDKAAKDLSIKVKGKTGTYTKFFTSGVIVSNDLQLDDKKDDVEFDRIYANADGVRGSGKRVFRYFPRINEWGGEVQFHVLADEISEDIFQQTLIQSGIFVGIGRFRPEKGGFYGRFEVAKLTWS